jgi:hypothetical protein
MLMAVLNVTLFDPSRVADTHPRAPQETGKLCVCTALRSDALLLNAVSVVAFPDPLQPRAPCAPLVSACLYRSIPTWAHPQYEYEYADAREDAGVLSNGCWLSFRLDLFRATPEPHLCVPAIWRRVVIAVQ